MKKLELNQMENLEGGIMRDQHDDGGGGSGGGGGGSIDCIAAGAGLMIGALTIGAVTGGIGLALWGAGMGLNVFGMMRSC